MRLVSVVTSALFDRYARRFPTADRRPASAQTHFNLRIDESPKSDAPIIKPRAPACSALQCPASPEQWSAGSPSHSSKRIGRLSSADGRRKPYSTRVSLRERPPAIHRANLRR